MILFLFVDVEVFKRVLREVASSDPAFIRDVFIDALRGDGKAVEAIVDLIARNPEARLRLWLNVTKIVFNLTWLSLS